MVWYSIFLYLWDLFQLWLHTLFVAPFINLDMLWILVPVWFSWFFAEFFQEKIGTSMGNAISNATIVLWASVDSARQTVNLIVAGTLTSGLDIFTRFFLLAVLFAYGIIIIVFGLKGNPIIKKIGRIRETTYVFAIFVPVFYNKLPLTLNHVLAALLFFPLFYYAIELIDRILPNPKAVKMDEKEVPKQKPEAGTDIPNQPSQPAPQNRPVQPNQPPPNYPPRNPPNYPRRKSDFWNFNF